MIGDFVFGLSPRLGLSCRALALAGVLSACTPMRSTIQPPFPYQGALYEEAQIRVIADAYCKNIAPSRQPAFAFTTDGCSMVPDGDWGACCVEHDMKYWCGGDREQRLDADKELKQCVASDAGPARAQLMFLGTRLGGLRRLPFGWRWGYGHSWTLLPHRDNEDAQNE